MSASRVLVLAAHLDDAVLGCGGLLAQLTDAEARVEVLCLMDGACGVEPDSGSEHALQWAARARRSAEVLGIAAVHEAAIPNGTLDRHMREAREALAERFGQLRPDLVLGPSPLAISADHYAAFGVLHGLLGDARGPEAFPPGLQVLLYEIDHPQYPDLLVDVGAGMPRLEAALACHAGERVAHGVTAAALGLRRFRTLTLPASVTHAEAYRRLEAGDLAAYSLAQLTESLGGTPRLVPVQGGPLVSVVVRTRNRPSFLAEALASLAASTYRSVEVVLVNDGGLPPAVPAEYPFPVRRVDLEEQKGRAAAAQAGLDSAEGTFVTFLDDDDLAAPEHLETLVTLASTTRSRVVYTDAAVAVFEVGPGGAWTCVERRIPYSRDFDAEWLAVDNYIPFNTILAERALLLEVGGLDLRFDRMEDWDLLIRLSQRTPFRHLARVTCEYRHFRGAADHSLAAGAATRDELSEARARVLEKHMPRFDAATLARAVTRLREEAVDATERATEMERQRNELERQARTGRERLSSELQRVYREEARLTTILEERQRQLDVLQLELQRVHGGESRSRTTLEEWQRRPEPLYRTIWTSARRRLGWILRKEPHRVDSGGLPPCSSAGGRSPAEAGHELNDEAPPSRPRGSGEGAEECAGESMRRLRS